MKQASLTVMQSVDLQLENAQSIEYTVSGKATIVVIVLASGYTLVGHSAPVSAADFNKELGEQRALANARNSLIELEAYRLSSLT